MARKQGNPVGVYSPLTWRARRLIRQLRHATHRSVQNALIQELMHELQRRRRKAQKRAGSVRKAASAYAKKTARKVAGRAGQGAGRLWHRVWYGPRLHCAGCGKDFHNRLQFRAHSLAHQRQAMTTPARGQKARGRPAPTVHQKARQHARDHLAAASPQDRQKVRQMRDAAYNSKAAQTARSEADARAARSADSAARAFARADELDRKGLPAQAAQARDEGHRYRADVAKYEGKYLYPAGQGRVIGSDKPLSRDDIAGLKKQMDDVRKMQAAGRVKPGDTVRTHTVGDRQVSRKVEGADGKTRPVRAKAAAPSAGRSRSRTPAPSPKGASS